MYQIDEKLMADDRAIVAIAANYDVFDKDLKIGMLTYDVQEKIMFFVSDKGKYSKFIHSTPEGIVPGDITFGDNVVIKKNLTVLGESVTLDTKTLLIEDNTITLNKGETGDGITEQVAGIEIDRGTLPKAEIAFHEKVTPEGDEFFDLSIGEAILLTSYANGDFYITGKAFLPALEVEGTSVLKDSVNIQKNLTVNGAVIVDETLEVGEDVSISGDAKITGNTTISGTAIIESDVTIEGNTTLTAINASDDITTAKEISSASLVTIDASIENLEVKNTIVGKDLSVKTLVVEEESTFTGKISANEIEATDVSISSIDVKKDALIETLTVAGTTELQGETTVSGATTLKDDVTAEKNLSTNQLAVATTADITSDLTVGGKLDVTGETSLGANFSVAGDAAIAKNLNVGGDLNVDGDTVLKNITGTSVETETLCVTGDSQLSNLTIENDITIDGITTMTTANAKEFVTTRVDGTEGFYIVSDDVKNGLSKTNYRFSDNTDLLLDLNCDYINFSSVAGESNKQQGFLFSINDNEGLLEISEDKVKSKNPIYVWNNDKWDMVLTKGMTHGAAHSRNGSDPISPLSIGAIDNGGGTVPTISAGKLANRPTPGNIGSLYYTSDTLAIYFDKGNEWVLVGSVTWENVKNKPDSYAPVQASSTVLGGIKIGQNLTITEDGVLSAVASSLSYVIKVEEFTTTADQTVFTLPFEYVRSCNLLSIYVLGRKLPPSAFEETSSTSFTLVSGLQENVTVEAFALIPSIPGIRVFIEEFVITAGQVELNLTKGNYTVDENRIKVYADGRLLPPSAFMETSSTSVQLKAAPEVGTIVMVEY